MKKSLIALAVLATATVATTAQAASSVTMYGRTDIGYVNSHVKTNAGVDTNGLTQGTSAANSEGETRFGVKGVEDLGNGLSATFQLEGRFDLSTGAKPATRSFFDRESTIGLKGNFGHVRFGRSKSALENGLADIGDPTGRRFNDVTNYHSLTRHSNAMFYSNTIAGVTFGADVTTKGGLNDGQTVAVLNNDGAAGTKVAYGAYVNYAIGGLKMAAAYQADKNNAVGKIDKEYGIGLAYNLKPVTLGATYTMGDDAQTVKTKFKFLAATLQADLTPNDNVFVKYTRKTVEKLGVYSTKDRQIGLGGTHSLSKRTSVSLEAARLKGLTATSTFVGANIRHNF